MTAQLHKHEHSNGEETGRNDMAANIHNSMPNMVQPLSSMNAENDVAKG